MKVRTIDKATWEATRSVLIPSRPTPILTARLGMIPIKRVMRRRFQGVVRQRCKERVRSDQITSRGGRNETNKRDLEKTIDLR